MSLWKSVEQFFTGKRAPTEALTQKVKEDEKTMAPSRTVGDWVLPKREVKRVEITRPTVVSKRRRKEKSASEVNDQVAEVRDEVVIREFEDFYTFLLPIDEFIPAGLDKRCVKGILIWFWQGGFIEGKYKERVYLKDSLEGKGFRPEELDRVFQWLDNQRLLIPDAMHMGGMKGQGKRLVSLRIKAQRADTPMMKELRALIATAFYNLDKAVGR